MIFHSVDFNDVFLPPGFLCALGSKMMTACVPGPSSAPLFGAHVDLKNTFWSFMPPLKANKDFRFGFRPGGGACVLHRMRRMLVGWKYSPLA